MWPFNRKQEEDRSYTDLLTQILANQAAGSVDANVLATSALESCCGLVGRAFASARVEGADVSALSSSCLMMVGRQLIRSGEIVMLISVEGGMISLAPASSHDVLGGPENWNYTITVSGPSSQTTYTSVDAASVLHFRYAADPATPWKGYGPLQVARLAGKLSAETVAALGDEASGPRGAFLPQPKPGDDSTLGPLAAQIKSARGGMVLVEGMQSGFGSGETVRRDWESRRFGASPPDALVELARTASNEIYAACGLSPALFGERSDGTAQRESWRRALHGTIAPLGKIVEEELKYKLDAPTLNISFDELYASDLMGRARAFQSMTQSGMDIAKAASLSGLMEPE